MIGHQNQLGALLSPMAQTSATPQFRQMAVNNTGATKLDDIASKRLNEMPGDNQLIRLGQQTVKSQIEAKEKENPLGILKPLVDNFMAVDPKARPLRVDIIGDNSVYLYQFIGYLLEAAGELTKIYEEICREVVEGNERRHKEYLAKLKEQQTTHSYEKLELPKEEPLPPKRYETMFEEYIKLREMSITDEFQLRIFDKDFIFQYKMLDVVTPERIRTLPDAVVFLVGGQEAEFQKYFIECDEIKQSFFMHLFFGTRNLYFFAYFSYRDRLLRHYEYQLPHFKAVKDNMGKIFQFISKVMVIRR